MKILVKRLISSYYLFLTLSDFMYILRTTQKAVFISGIVASLAIGFVLGNVWTPLQPEQIGRAHV